MLGSVLVLMLPLLVWLTPDLRIKKSLLKCNWTIRKRLPRCKMRLKKRLLAFSRRLHARIRSEERFSRNAETEVVCRLLLEKKKEQLVMSWHQVKGGHWTTAHLMKSSFSSRLSFLPIATSYRSILSLHDALPISGFENQKELTKMQLDNQKEIAEMQNETQKEIAGIQSATSRQNTKDQVYAQNEMLAYQQKESTARVASIMENTNLSKQQQVSEIMRQMLTQAQTAGQYFTNDQIKEMTRKVSAEVDLVHQQTQNQRYGSSHIGAT